MTSMMVSMPLVNVFALLSSHFVWFRAVREAGFLSCERTEWREFVLCLIQDVFVHHTLSSGVMRGLTLLCLFPLPRRERGAREGEGRERERESEGGERE